jgi:DNA-binding beta-propeller fold protein YncE
MYDIAYDGSNLLSADGSNNKILKHSGYSTTITDSFSNPAYIPIGLAWDGVNVISTNNYGKLYKHDGFTSTVLSSFVHPRGTNWIVAEWGDGNLHSSEKSTGKIYKHSGFSTTILDSFSSPSAYQEGLAWDGTNIYSCDSVAHKVYKHDGFSSTILDSFICCDIGSGPNGLTLEYFGC